MAGRPRISHERLLELVSYDPETGIFTRRANRVGCHRDVLGTRHTEGYLVLDLDRKTYGAHRLAWFYVHGKWPKHQIDHRDRNRANNRITNLREATSGNNAANRPRQSCNTSGFKGVFWIPKKRKWVARICCNYKRYHLGTFETPEQAHAAYVEAANRLFGEFARAA